MRWRGGGYMGPIPPLELEYLAGKRRVSQRQAGGTGSGVSGMGAGHNGEGGNISGEVGSGSGADIIEAIMGGAALGGQEYQKYCRCNMKRTGTTFK